ncbi:MAG TPA: ABC transporter ATP-binding protein [Gemmatimonadaceae bacterium]|nr:ABC transporter ATP-binding protein [Gemmatimonadaceae bacterium]
MKSLRRLLPYFRPYRSPLAAGLALVVVSAGFAATIPWLLRAAIDGMRAGAPPGRFWQLGAAMVGLALVGGAARYGMRELLNGVSRWIEYDLRNDLFARLAALDAAYYARTRTGDIMARLTNDLGAVRMAAGPAIMYLVNTVAGGAFALVFMLRIDARLTGLALLPMIVLPVVMARLGKAIHDRFEEVQEHFGTMTTHVQENLSGVRVVRAYRQEGAEAARFATLNDGYLARNMRLARLYGTMNPAFAFFAGLGAVVALGVGGSLALEGRISVGAFVAFGFYLGMLTWPLIAFGWVINLFQRGAASMARLTAILDERSPIRPGAGGRATLPPSGGGRRLEFRGVGFHYPTSDGAEPRWVLRDVSFDVPAGTVLGVVGATGSGKSALMDLIPRFHEPQEGAILLDGVPIRDLDPAALRREIGYVPQESLLFSDTIAANLAYGTGEDDGATRWAAAVAQLDATIAAFPGGYDTVLGERGINLSGGQKQRAALARALARRPSLVLLDDALSAVDTHTEAEILRALRETLAARTAVIASHRVSAIRDAHWIIVLDEGRIVEQGRHADLLALGGRYWALLSRQQLVESIEETGDGELAEASPDGRIGP